MIKNPISERNNISLSRTIVAGTADHFRFGNFQVNQGGIQMLLQMRGVIAEARAGSEAHTERANPTAKRVAN